MPSLLKRRLAICAGVFVAVWASLALYLVQQPRFFSSPTASREDVESDLYAPYRSWREYDQAEISSDGNSPARARFNLKRADSDEEIFIISEPPRFHPARTGKASNIQKLPVTRAEHGTATLPEGWVRLLAVAARWNTGDPKLDLSPQEAEFFDTESLHAFEWDRSEAPREWRALPPADPNTVRLRFLLQASDDSTHFFPGNTAVFDARTHYMAGTQEAVQIQGDFAVLDVTATLWHDTPIELVFDLPRGTPRLLDLPATARSTVWPAAPRAPVFNVLASGPGRLIEVERPAKVDHPFFSGRALKVTPGTGAYLLFNTSHTEIGEFFQLRLSDGESHWFQSTTHRFGQIQTSKPLNGAKLAFYPERDRLWFDVSRLPMMPNRRGQVRNLFEVKIPFVDATQPDASEKIVKAAQMQLKLNVRFVSLQQQFYDLTPDAYLTLLNPVYATMSDDKSTIHLGAPPESWVVRVKKWWAETF